MMRIMMTGVGSLSMECLAAACQPPLLLSSILLLSVRTSALFLALRIGTQCAAHCDQEEFFFQQKCSKYEEGQICDFLSEESHLTQPTSGEAAVTGRRVT